MPKRIDLREGESIDIRGVTVAVAIARGKRATLGIAIEDSDGLLEEKLDVRRWAWRLAAKVDKGPPTSDY